MNGNAEEEEDEEREAQNIIYARMPVAVSLPMNDKVLMRASFHHVQKGVCLCMGCKC